MNNGNVREHLNLSLKIINATIDPDIPVTIDIAPSELRNISAIIHVPTEALGLTELNLTITVRTSDGDYSVEKSYRFIVRISGVFQLIPQDKYLDLKEKETRYVTIRLENLGNIWQNGTLILSGDDKYCFLDRTQFNISPFSNATVNLTISGKRGAGSLNLTFRSQWIDTGAKVNYTIKANQTGATAPYDWTPLLLFVLILVVLAVGIGLWWWFVEVPARPRRKDPP